MKIAGVLAGLAWMGATWAGAGEPSPEAAATIVVYNRNDAASKALAEYYAGKRDIPKAQLLGLACSQAEEISRDAYLVTIEAPLRAAFTKFGWWRTERGADGRRFVAEARVRFVALMRGVPMKISPAAGAPPPDYSREIAPGSPIELLRRHNEASVDSELAALFTLRGELPGVVWNPYYRRFSRILEVPPAEAPLLVGRLDGPSDAVVRRMVDDALAAERTGLWGMAYLDARNITSGPYAPGDKWLAATGALLRRQGIPVVEDHAPETLPEGYPVTAAALYYGWYAGEVNGPFARDDLRFRPGAIAVHLHSFSARTLRDPRAAWAAPLLARGAAATLGNVYEPYLELTVHFDIFQDRLMNGFTLAEAAYAGYPGLSWMSVIVGDPLYRPYAQWFELGDGSDAPPNIWRQYRSTVLAAGGDPVAAAAALRQLAARTGQSMPLEALGEAQAAAGDREAALASLDDAAAMEKSPAGRLRIALEQIDLVRRAGDVAAARARVAAAREKFSSAGARFALDQIARALNPSETPPP